MRRFLEFLGVVIAAPAAAISPTVIAELASEPRAVRAL
jgi:hypothetical protein